MHSVNVSVKDKEKCLRQTERQSKKRQRHKQTDIWADRQTGKQKRRENERDRQIGKQYGRKTDKQTESEREERSEVAPDKQTGNNKVDPSPKLTGSSISCITFPAQYKLKRNRKARGTF